MQNAKCYKVLRQRTGKRGDGILHWPASVGRVAVPSPQAQPGVIPGQRDATRAPLVRTLLYRLSRRAAEHALIPAVNRPTFLRTFIIRGRRLYEQPPARQYRTH